MKMINNNGRREGLCSLLICLSVVCSLWNPAYAALTTDYEYRYDASGYLTGQCVYVSSNTVTLSVSQRTTDAMGRDTLSISGSGDTAITTGYSYDVAGNLTCKTIENGNDDVLTQYTYDILGRQVMVAGPNTSLSNADCATTMYIYDPNGNVITQSVKQESDYAHTYKDYDALNRVTRIVDPENCQRKTVYNSRSLPIREYAYKTDGMTILQQTRTVYDAAGRVISRIVMLAPTESGAPSVTNDQVVVYGYDDGGHVTSQTAYNMRSSTALTTVKEYDGLGRLIKTTDPKSFEESLEINAYGQVTKRIFDDGTEHVTDMEYDTDGRLTKSIAVGPPALTTQYEYDGLGRQTEVTDPEGRAVAHYYDTLGREILKIEDADPTAGLKRTTEYKYSQRGVLTAIVANDGAPQETVYGYAPCGQVSSITYPDENVMYYSYCPSGAVTMRIDQAGNTLQYSYDKRGLLLTKRSPSGDYFLTYVYDDLGRMVTARKGTSTTQDADSQVVRYYNGLSQVIGEDQSIKEQTARNLSMEYDQAGNRMTLFYPN